MRLLATALFLAACGGAPKPASAPPQGQLEHSMRNCPSAVVGAVTRAKNTVGGVDLEITAETMTAQKQILDLALLHERMGDPDGSAMQHTGLHGGPGEIGHCPVIHAATLVSVTRIPTGAVIHIRALLAADVERLQEQVADRVSHLARAD